jgi:hypothetical protein
VFDFLYPMKESIVIIPDYFAPTTSLKNPPEKFATYVKILSSYLISCIADIRKQLSSEPQSASHAKLDRNDLMSIIIGRKFSYLSKGVSRVHTPRVNDWLDHHLKANLPLTFFLLYHGGYRAWPVRSELSLTFQPDQTELMLLWQIALFQQSVARIYPPGIEFTIVINNGVALWTNEIPLERTTE